MDTAEFSRKESKEKVDFVLALTSLFKKALSKDTHKFTIYLQNGGIVYYFLEDTF